MFPYAFWGQDYGKVEVLNRVAPATNPGSWSETYSLLPITGQPVLVAFNAADTAWALERTLKSQAEYQAHIMAVLRNIFGPAVPQPISVSCRAAAARRAPHWMPAPLRQQPRRAPSTAPAAPPRPLNLRSLWPPSGAKMNSRTAATATRARRPAATSASAARTSGAQPHGAAACMHVCASSRCRCSRRPPSRGQ